MLLCTIIQDRYFELLLNWSPRRRQLEGGFVQIVMDLRREVGM